ncbi:hypothetical protein GO013_13835 [Pseudodesulfovibrio sp. JC047]|uniref:hypothetical protein n=1 Tax=Pseudodesulfovibrio sp. JC047 TaxID=2683199 RepID=UPI0013D62A47|nr:hypothetical protein [Pseudodesulfovibrio sp. JC047]NDV20492.1 hypothetical protein [Pseudodesulfovibrio sp. JC047]
MSDKKCMQIQAAHLNHAFMQKLQARQNQGENLGAAAALLETQPSMRLGQMAHINTATVGVQLVRKPSAMAQGQTGGISGGSDSLGSVFANEVIRRMGEVDGEDGQPKDSSEFRDSLASAMDWIRERFGDETAAAASGMVLQATSSEVSEETVGTGLLNTLQFIDRNFGYAAGDAAISRFNSGINDAANTFFDNGKNEVFFVADAPPQDGPSTTQDQTQRLVVQGLPPISATSEADASLTAVLDELKGELDQIAELQDLSSTLESKFNPTAANRESAVAAYQAQPSFAEPQFTSQMV